MVAAGARTKRPCHSHPSGSKACNCPAGGAARPGGQEMRDKGGGASLGEAGLEVAPPSSEGPQRMLEGDWEDRSDAGTTWRTFLAHSCRSS